MINISKEEIREIATNNLLLYLKRLFNRIKSNEIYSLLTSDFILSLEENIYIYILVNKILILEFFMILITKGYMINKKK